MIKMNTSDRYSRLSHQIFASSLRNEEALNYNNYEVESVKYTKWVNKVMQRLLSNNRVDLMKMMELDKLHECELDFLKSAVSYLSYVSGLYHTEERKSLSLLKRWAGYPITEDLNAVDSAKEIYISRAIFKNTLLKLFINKTRDYRVVQMKEFLNGHPPTSAIEMYNNTTEKIKHADISSVSPRVYQECTGVKSSPTKNTRFVPKYEYSPKTTIGRLKQILDTPDTPKDFYNLEICENEFKTSKKAVTPHVDLEYKTSHIKTDISKEYPKYIMQTSKNIDPSIYYIKPNSIF
ncbi:hypothetical protein BEWA_007510 [Theileria equi strain WA]|uniref:Uncharacterized protein n=1 Tax=Theileria equi strain WA TaxID=1537102 RepID=L0B0G3_THEEQ|nr:hypothetical protein BEWA_007510 [Theileria equi strain WA]AFZ81342.1 hypothetical protein BEWA_007510 [Theileria equi strain WA]|eukprot:XP_004831008.1 hypothetical protein BEWA_007510 [Theileria equi strain WA]